MIALFVPPSAPITALTITVILLLLTAGVVFTNPKPGTSDDEERDG